MNQSYGWAAVAFGVALVATNGAWLCREALRGVDQLSVLQYQRTNEDQLRETAKGALLAMPTLASDLSRPEVVRRVAMAVGAEPFEKDGATVVGWLSLRFDDAGRLVDVRSVFEPDLVFTEAPP
jgi:hypothetical protein